MRSDTQLKEITGLKGMASLIVMLSHYTIAFFPAVWNAEYQLEHIKNFEKFIHRTPLYFFANGSLMVSVFWCISGFLIGYAWFQNKSLQMLKRRVLGRYFKLVVPITLSMLIAYIFQIGGLFYNDVAATYTWSEWLRDFYQFEPSLLTCVFDGLIGIFFVGSGKYNPILWTIKGEVFGICMSALFLAIWGNEEKEKRSKAYVFFVIIVNVIYQPLLPFIIGIFVADKYLQDMRLTKKMCLFCLGGALILGSFLPIWAFIPAEIFYLNKYSLSIGDIFRAISAGLLLMCVLNSVILKKILSMKILSFLGNISMYIYIFHFSIMCSLACGIFVFISRYIDNYLLIALFSILSGILITVYLSALFKKGVDIINKKILDTVYSLL